MSDADINAPSLTEAGDLAAFLSTNPPTLPQELLDEICNCVVATGDKATLKNLAATSSRFCERSRRHLFRDFKISLPPRGIDPERARITTENPALLKHVRSFEFGSPYPPKSGQLADLEEFEYIELRPPGPYPEDVLQGILRIIDELEDLDSLTISGEDMGPWSTANQHWKDIVLKLLQRPHSVRKLSLHWVCDLPYGLIRSLPGLQTLETFGSSLYDDGNTSTTTPWNLTTLRCDFDFSTRIGMHFSPSFLYTNLTHLHISIGAESCEEGAWSMITGGHLQHAPLETLRLWYKPFWASWRRHPDVTFYTFPTFSRLRLLNIAFHGGKIQTGSDRQQTVMFLNGVLAVNSQPALEVLEVHLRWLLSQGMLTSARGILWDDFEADCHSLNDAIKEKPGHMPNLTTLHLTSKCGRYEDATQRQKRLESVKTDNVAAYELEQEGIITTMSRDYLSRAFEWASGRPEVTLGDSVDEEVHAAFDVPPKRLDD